MHSDWKTFLESRAAGCAPLDAARFPNAPVEADCALVDLSHLGLLAIGGADAEHFLQGQISNDLRELSEHHSQLSAHCSAKGRMLANFRVWRDDERLFLHLPRTQLPALMQRLRLFVLRSQVTLEDLSDTWVSFGILGEAASAPLTEQFAPLPTDDNAIARAEDGVLIRIPGSLPRWLFVGAPARAQAIWSALCGVAVAANADLWALQDIRAGLPMLSPETADLFVPQMANMHLIDGLSFHKGCYTGQEVVARMQYLGKLKRRMYWAEIDAEQCPRPGDLLHAPESQSGQGPGVVVDARRNAAGRCELLAVVEIALAEGGGQVSLADGAVPLTLRAPPYGLPAEF